jgi:hypothetical protein
MPMTSKRKVAMDDDRIADACWRIAGTDDRPYGSPPHDRYDPRRARRRPPVRQPARSPAPFSPPDDLDPSPVGQRLDVKA